MLNNVERICFYIMWQEVFQWRSHLIPLDWMFSVFILFFSLHSGSDTVSFKGINHVKVLEFWKKKRYFIPVFLKSFHQLVIKYERCFILQLKSIQAKIFRHISCMYWVHRLWQKKFRLYLYSSFIRDLRSCLTILICFSVNGSLQPKTISASFDPLRYGKGRLSISVKAHTTVDFILSWPRLVCTDSVRRFTKKRSSQKHWRSMSLSIGDLKSTEVRMLIKTFSVLEIMKMFSSCHWKQEPSKC